MSYRKWVSAGLVFLGMRDIDIVAAGNRASTALEALGARVRQTRVESGDCVRITTETHRLQLSLHTDRVLESLEAPAALYLGVKVCRERETAPISLQCDAILAHLLRVLHRDLVADYIKWIGPRALICNTDFVRATARLDDPSCNRWTAPANPPASARPAMTAADSLPGIDEHSERLDLILRREAPWATAPTDQEELRRALHEAAPSAPQAEDIREATAALRLSAWMISYAVALFCLPIGIALVIVNLLRGENLRLASQAAALTGTFLSLQATGSMAQAATTLQILLL